MYIKNKSGPKTVPLRFYFPKEGTIICEKFDFSAWGHIFWEVINVLNVQLYSKGVFDLVLEYVLSNKQFTFSSLQKCGTKAYI